MVGVAWFELILQAGFLVVTTSVPDDQLAMFLPPFYCRILRYPFVFVKTDIRLVQEACLRCDVPSTAGLQAATPANSPSVSPTRLAISFLRFVSTHFLSLQINCTDSLSFSYRTSFNVPISQTGTYSVTATVCMLLASSQNSSTSQTLPKTPPMSLRAASSPSASTTPWF
jgi:hypothetical protein